MHVRRCRAQRGAALAEFALIAPFLAMLAFASVDLGRAYNIHNRLANASREGAAYAQFYPGQVGTTGNCANPENIPYRALGEDRGTASGFTVTVTNVDTGLVLSPTSCVRPGDVGAIATGTRLKVTVAATFTALTPFSRQFIGSPATLRRSTQVVVQG